MAHRVRTKFDRSSPRLPLPTSSCARGSQNVPAKRAKHATTEGPKSNVVVDPIAHNRPLANRDPGQVLELKDHLYATAVENKQVTFACIDPTTWIAEIYAKFGASPVCAVQPRPCDSLKMVNIDECARLGPNTELQERFCQCLHDLLVQLSRVQAVAEVHPW